MATSNDAERRAAATLAFLNNTNDSVPPLEAPSSNSNGETKASARSPGTNSTGAAVAGKAAQPPPPLESVLIVDNDQNNKKKRGKKRQAEEIFNYPVEPTVVQVIKKPRTTMNHSYRDFSKVPADIKQDAVVVEDINLMSFPQKVHHILSQDEFRDCVSWMPHGRAFKTHLPKVFEQTACKKYFGHQRYSSFLRQLANYGFKHITQGNDRNCYYHECMLQDRPHLTKYMPKPKDARRLIPDPENEPDFYEISRQYPLSDEPVVDAKKPAAVEEAMVKPPPAKRARITAPSSAVPPVAVPAAIYSSNISAAAPQVNIPVSFASSNNLLTEVAKARAASNAAALLAAVTGAPDRRLSAMTAALSAPPAQPAALTATDVLLARHMAAEPARVALTLEDARKVMALAAAAEAQQRAQQQSSLSFLENALRLAHQPNNRRPFR